MSTQLLPVILGNTEYELGETIPRVPPGRAPKRYMEFISRSYRQRAIAAFLLTGSFEDLGKNLQRSATAWLQFLRAADDAEKASSKAQAFFCAIACNDIPTATEIARSSRYTLNRDEEYEDDFLYVAFLMRTFFLGVDGQESQRWLARLEAFLSGEPSPQLEVCRALLDRDASAFDQALRRRIAQQREWLAEALERDAVRDDEYATDGQLFVEGLALVRIAERIGLAVAEEFPLVPSLARRASAAGGPDSWRVFDGT